LFISTTAARKVFELFCQCGGEFTILAAVEVKSKNEHEGDQIIWLSRYLDLPERRRIGAYSHKCPQLPHKADTSLTRSRRPKMTDAVDKVGTGMARAAVCLIRLSPVRGMLAFARTAAAGDGNCLSCHAGERLVGRRAPAVVRERFEVLHGGRQMELVARAGEASQTHALKAMVGLQ